MRNWNATASLASSREKGVSSLPMRNWNRSGRRLLYLQDKGIQPTYEELKHWYHSQTLSLIRVSSLPMRNWNSSKIPCKPLSWKYPAYLWGIETFYCRRTFVARIASIQPTYEELKQNIGRKGYQTGQEYPAYLWGIETPISCHICMSRSRIQPTYEELKRLSMVASTKSGSGIQPTYEELKLFRSAGPPLVILVSSLPMRNWNALRQCGGTATDTGIQPTYEELKLNPEEKEPYAAFKYPAYLWGIETP